MDLRHANAPAPVADSAVGLQAKVLRIGEMSDGNECMRPKPIVPDGCSMTDVLQHACETEISFGKSFVMQGVSEILARRLKNE